MRHKSLPTEFKVHAERREIEGYAATFGNVDAVSDVIESGAFTKTLRERMPKNLIKVLRQHHQPIGVPVSAEEDSTGLFTVSKISRTPLGDETLTLVEDGVMDRMSIGYDVIKADFAVQAGRDVRLLKELKLYEYGPVIMAANDEAVVTAVKSLDDAERVFELFPDAVKRLLDMSDGELVRFRTRHPQLRKAVGDLMALKGLEPSAGTPTPPEPPTPESGDPDLSGLQSLLDRVREYRTGLVH